MTMRNLARVGATGLLAAGTLALAAAPAFAADVDFGLSLKGTTIAVGASGKPATLTFTNNGTSKPKEVGVLFDATKLDDSKVKLDLGDCTLTDGIADCVIDGSAIPGPGESSDLDLPLIKQTGATGAAGKLTVTLKVDGDTNKANDSKTVDVTVGGSGVDLRVLAPDVTAVDGDGEFTGKAIPPGGSSVVEGYVANHGDKIATGFTFTLVLPKDVSFAEKFDGCDYSANGLSATCDLSTTALIPADLDTDESDGISAVAFHLPVTVSKDAKGPVSLSGGSFAATAVGQQDVPDLRSLAKKAAPKLPAMATALTAAQADEFDVDATDNSDGFAVLVAGPSNGQGGGSGDGEDGGGLPVTGPVAGTIGGAGLAVIVAGAVLFFSARRRRVVLVTPGDEK